jgi:hypothetical protein
MSAFQGVSGSGFPQRQLPLLTQADMSGSPSLLRKLAIEAHSTAARIFLL